ncbi:RCC1-like domain-containing protein [Hymenobacter sp. BRD67]|uniref:RCC1-like domain-containing protein n=1 Tax=Hymenobacter sp. BRD67 TaxID=2675877 RepID=UPI001566615F|nr:RCC1 domain-containing protein [Hymenobacter sp. BRD67]QKG54962.1 IPT/TIG domain-containing protein [Hymenobacter sp. BRD67]
MKTVTSGFTVNAAGTQITGVVVPAGAQSGPVLATTTTGTSLVGPVLFSRATSLAVGGYHTVAVRADGSLWAWGRNDAGQLGLGSTSDQTSPQRVGTATTWVSAAAGTSHTVAVRADGTLWAWGNNDAGQLGLGTTTSPTSPTQIGTATTWASAAAGGYHTLAVRADGTLWAWGNNDYGQLGQGTYDSQPSPTQVGAATSWVSAAAGNLHSLAVQADGTLWVWGDNYYGQLGLGSYAGGVTSPTQVGAATSWVSAAAGNLHTVATQADGSLWAWGNNYYGQLGLGTTTTQPGPTQVGTATSWASAAAGGYHTVAVRADGTLWAWGFNGFGQLGQGNYTRQTSPAQVGTGTSWASAAAGGYHAAGEQSCRAVWAWGENGSGQVGDGSTTQRPSPVRVYNPVSLLSFAPSSAAVGSTVAVTGTGLAGLTALSVNGVDALASVTGLTDTGFSFVVPAGAGATGTVTVTAGCGSASSAAFTVVPPPGLTALSPGAELPGLPVVLTGTGFTSTSTVSFGGVAATSVTYTSPTSLTAVVPATAPAGSSAVVVGTAGGSSASASSPAFTVLSVYDGGPLATCAPALPATATVADGAWHYLLSSTGQVVLAYNYTGASLGSFAADVLRADPASPVRQDGRGHPYLDRNWHLTASGGPFAGRTVQLRFYGLTSELARLQAADGTATLSNLKATQYSGASEDCTLGNDDFAGGEFRSLAAPASTPGNGVAWFMAQVSVADHFSEFYLTGSAAPLPVELLTFTAVAEGAGARLRWATASELSSARFEGERSPDGVAWERIGTVAAAGSSSTVRRYELLDARLPAGPAVLYYRLRQVDLDGTAHYSPLRAVQPTGAATSLSLFPNPAPGGAATLTGPPRRGGDGARCPGPGSSHGPGRCGGHGRAGPARRGSPRRVRGACRPPGPAPDGGISPPPN